MNIMIRLNVGGNKIPPTTQRFVQLPMKRRVYLAPPLPLSLGDSLGVRGNPEENHQKGERQVEVEEDRL
jgi:hypothetical protein